MRNTLSSSTLKSAMTQGEFNMSSVMQPEIKGSFENPSIAFSIKHSVSLKLSSRSSGAKSFSTAF